MANNLQHFVTVMPRVIPFRSLQEITNNFAEEQVVGHGGYGEVYKGIYEGVEIAVKKLYLMPYLGVAYSKQFDNELLNLMSVQHQNIIKLIGYCYEVYNKVTLLEERYIYVESEQRFLCFEYMRRGSLDKHLSDESGGLDWHTRYKIIMGVSEGLNFLHNGLKDPVYHLDLKPANILLDESWMPKICDFGLSRLVASTKSHNTVDRIGSHPFMPPEYIVRGTISKKYDVFSLGVTIIQIIAGPQGYSKYSDMSSQEFTELVHMNWRGRIGGTSTHVEEYCQQVKKCIKIASDCVEQDKDRRPTIEYIMETLEHIETVTHRTVKEEEELLEQIETPIHRAIEEENEGEQEQEKYGPWGGNAGTAHDIEAASHQLHSVTILWGDVIDSFKFTYSDHSGHQHIVGPWGGTGGTFQTTIKLGPREFLTEISGKFGPYSCSQSDVITSLKFVTNEEEHGPFGLAGLAAGDPFRIKLESNWAIVGFFARAEGFVHAIGVYARPNRSTS
ncbi:probable serine/threonine-protein kinase PBL6 [Triticum dicoccoides]|uniref:non-specific serine/threonine protein kinase n=1 Tax=Triticum turgidum subsp. durum TaxID=4567 RepID=A0A9R0WYB5_TRITD|nr:probable serine/threonine-protein kinase PBL6 [Triticum dicoccoides]VAI26639.1 unnamed protein product [Triticum turgidum subsp. durum]